MNPTSADDLKLRERIAFTLAAADRWTWATRFDTTQSPIYQGYLHRADAVIAEVASEQRTYLRQQGYDLDCVCEGCSACLAREYIDFIDPAESSP